MSDQQVEINLSSSALGKSGCALNLHRTIIDGYKPKLMPARMVYGVGVHKFIQVMYLTGGHILTAREEAIRVFNDIPKLDDRKSMHMSDANHMTSVALWTWQMCVEKDDEFEILQLESTCWNCKGNGYFTSIPLDTGTASKVLCERCSGKGLTLNPAVEVTFSIPYYSDQYVKINWCGTLDRIGKIKNGIFIIPDWKTTSSWSEKEYFIQFEMARAPRGYILSLKLMAELYPDSILGQIGKQTIGARFDGVFVKPAINEVRFARSEVYRYTEQEMLEFRMLLDDKCKEISSAIRTGYLPKQGLINGSCEGKWGKCSFWNVCQKPDVIANIMLERDFDKKSFNPLAYNE